MVVLDINPSISGISGDMFAAALLGLIENSSELVDSVTKELQQITQEFDVKLETKQYHGISGWYLKLDGELNQISAGQLSTYVTELLEKFKIDSVYSEWAQTVLTYLFDAEKSVHQTEDIHLHELGSVDTIFDILIPAIILSRLKITHIMIDNVNTGKGSVKTAHGILPVPSPAAQYILQEAQLPTITTVEGEATTPTGAAILAASKKIFSKADSVIWNQNSFGFGTKEFADRGNMLRLRTGKVTREKLQIEILETNLDDISGEHLGYTLKKLMELGALDVSYYPIYMKKNRPGYTLRVLSSVENTDKLASEILKLTGTLGVRITQIDRHIGERSVETRSIYVKEWKKEVKINVKIGSRLKFEFDDLTKLAEKYDLSPLEVESILMRNMEVQ